MKHSQEAIREAQEQDPIKDAIDILGEGHKDVNGLALLLQLRRHEALKTMLTSNRDTYHGSTLQEYEQVLQELGATQVLNLQYTAVDKYEWPEKSKKRQESLNVWWSEDGILFVYTTYHRGMNGGHFYYNWRAAPDLKEREIDEYDFMSSGSYCKDPNDSTKYIWAGYHDIREALRMNVENLRKYGELLPKWVGENYVSLLHYQDYQDTDPENRGGPGIFERQQEINKERKLLLPPHVLAAITP